MDSQPMFKDLGRKKKAYEEVAGQIRDRIFSGGLRLGQRLPPERDLALQFGVSRVAVREAMRILELSGFVTVKKGARGGTFIAQDYDRPIMDSIANLIAGKGITLENLFDCREIIEPQAAARVAESGTEDDLQLLVDLMDEAEAESRRGTHIRPYNIRFHRMILRLCRNPVLSVVGETVLVVLSDQIKDLVSPETSLQALAMHRRILQALVQRKVEEVVRLMGEDIRELGIRFANLGGRGPRGSPPEDLWKRLKSEPV
ncbi:MAG: FadR family transcriptional regulator [Deltaproteobacteria bacterium]|nr:FadR family transcriptional regulator [Deltaproteobacteria bacterium]MBW2120426.1 FadR family transcriptional regulator [Deltaproteobacteria bacterium]